MTKAQDAKTLIDSALSDLTEQLETGKSESLTQFLDMLSRFHSYSFGNVMLILSQRPDAVRVAGYRAWQKLGRQVAKGEKGITIIAPMVFKKDTDEAKGEGDKPVLRFKAVTVFDLAQTHGDELPEPVAVTGEPGHYLKKLTDTVRSQGIEIITEHLSGASGESRGGTILLDVALSDAERFSVLAHEFAHELLHQGDTSSERPAKAIRELEAEAVAYTVSRAVGLTTTTASSDYIQHFGGDSKLLASVLDRVQATAATIIDSVLTE